MGMKYTIYNFDYPYEGYENIKETRFLIVALLYFIIYTVKYDAVDIEVRK